MESAAMCYTLHRTDASHFERVAVSMMDVKRIATSCFFALLVLGILLPDHADANNLRNKHRLLEKRSKLQKQQTLDPKEGEEGGKKTDASGAAGGDPNNPYNVYFFNDKDMKPMIGGQTPTRKAEDIQGYSREARYNVRKWLHGPVNVLGREHVHGCASFPFCNHIPPPFPMTPNPWDIPAPVPRPIYPSLAPFPKNLFGKDNMYGRDMYTYKNKLPHYKENEKFWQ